MIKLTRKYGIIYQENCMVLISDYKLNAKDKLTYFTLGYYTSLPHLLTKLRYCLLTDKIKKAEMNKAMLEFSELLDLSREVNNEIYEVLGKLEGRYNTEVIIY